eukprot:scaffold803_cov310-Pinguiococcus_pyrenoidosus.AAC.17
MLPPPTELYSKRDHGRQHLMENARLGKRSWRVLRKAKSKNRRILAGVHRPGGLTRHTASEGLGKACWGQREGRAKGVGEASEETHQVASVSGAGHPRPWHRRVSTEISARLESRQPRLRGSATSARPLW